MILLYKLSFFLSFVLSLRRPEIEKCVRKSRNDMDAFLRPSPTFSSLLSNPPMNVKLQPESPSDEPVRLPQPKDADALLAKELNELSLREREQVYYDIHGVSDVVEETEELISTKLAQLDKELSKIAQEPQAAAYYLAVSQNSGYVEDPRFRIKFLRAELLDPQRAAQRIVRYFREKQALFGSEKLAEDIALSDLDAEDLKCFESGLLQVLPLRDRAGRAVLCWFPVRREDDSTIQSRVRSSLSVILVVYIYGFG